MNNFAFEYPYAFLIIFIFLICAYFCKERMEAVFFPRAKIFFDQSYKKNRLITNLKWATIILSVTALASPVIKNSFDVEKREGYAIALVLDASGSMRYPFSSDPNQPKSKFDIAKELSAKFVQKRKNDRIGLIVFGNFAYTAAPLTYDTEILKEIIDSLYAGIAGANYTVINEALFQTAKLFSNIKAKSKIAIFLTDGKSRGDTIPLEVAIRALKKYKVKIYTIGIGSEGDYNEIELQKIAKETGGDFFSAKNRETLEKIYTKIDKMEKSEIETDKFVKKDYLYEMPLFLAVLTLLSYIYLINRRGIA